MISYDDFWPFLHYSGSGWIQNGSGSTTDLFVLKLKKCIKMCSFCFIFLLLDPDSEFGSGSTKS
jgi:hypothetical protein